MYPNMSVGNTIPMSQGTPPAPVSRRRPDPRPTHKVSFKLTRPKPTKAKPLTSSELWGIGASFVLSCIISLALVYIAVTFTPILAQFTAEVVHDLFSMDQPSPRPRAHQEQKNQIQRISTFLTVENTLNCTAFLSNNHATLFKSSNSVDMYRDVVHYLTEDYAEEEVNVQRIEQLYRMTGDLTLTGFNGFTTSVKEFQAFEWELNAQLESGNHFVSDSAILSSMPELTKVIKTPLLPNSAELGDICTLRNGPFIDYQARVVSFGKRTAPFSGTGFHAHIRSLSELIEGRKHWVIFPPNQVPASGFNPFENLADWREHVFPTLLATDAAPIEIIQEAGQVVYIPEGWYHATQTLSESSLSIRYQPREVEPGSYYYYLVKGDQRAASDDYAAAAKLYRLGLAVQKDAVLYTRLGDALERLGQLTEAEEAYKEGLYCNPRDPYIYAMLVTFFVTHAKKDTSASVGELLQNAATYGLKEMVLKLMNDSL